MTSATTNRIVTIDILRGLVMIIMALDHTRDFFHNTAMTADPLDPATTTPMLYFTRWITHYCAPTFVFLSGLSAYLSSRSKSLNEASSFLLKRGLWLIIVEVTLVTFGLTFNPFYNFIILQVIWAIGVSMVLLGLFVRTSYKVVLAIGLLLVFAHNSFDYITLPKTGATTIITTVLMTARGAAFPIDKSHFIGAFYAVLPWTGLMFLGYSIGPWFKKDFPAERRKKLLLITGSALVVLFIVLRFARGYGDPGAWKPGEHSIFSFLDTSKYPPSLQYTCMTIGPSLLLLAFFENFQSAFTRVVSVYGRVPFFYYILHFYILHTLLVILFYATGHTSAQIFDPQSIFAFRPVNFGYGLPVVYLIWLSVVAVLYLPAKWFNHYKMTHQQWWLSYL
ncbi:MAG: hypothetical protein JWR18_2067 [Segetibacter sp.]|nr:hypothetical protein [Segetibacter sp.]